MQNKGIFSILLQNYLNVQRSVKDCVWYSLNLGESRIFYKTLIFTGRIHLFNAGRKYDLFCDAFFPRGLPDTGQG